MLIVSVGIKFKPLAKIAFALNYYRPNLKVPVSMIRRIINFTKASLYVINVVSPAEVITPQAERSKVMVKKAFEDLDPVYYEPAFENVITAIDNFTAAEGIDMLIVIPSRHGLWYNIFQRSHTRGLVYLNHVPILSLHREGEFLE